jgi:hypothetical protein
VANPHPHLGAAYQLLAFGDGTFGVVVTIPNMQPTTVKGFDTKTLAKRWIERHRESIAAGNALRSRPQYVRKPDST